MLTEGAARRSAGVDVVIGVVETHGRAETEALTRGYEIVPRRRDRLSGPHASPRWTSTRSSPGGRSSCWSTSSPTPTRPAAATPSATRTSRSCSPPASTSFDGQHPASRKPQRRRRLLHQGPGARDGARPRARKCRDRGRRHPARRADRAAEGGQGLCPRRGDAGARPFLLQVEPVGAARAGACAAPRRRSTRRCSTISAPMRWPAPGRRASGWSSRSASCPARKGWSAPPSASPTRCARPGPRSISRRRARARFSDAEREQLAAAMLQLAAQLGGNVAERAGGQRRSTGSRRFAAEARATQLVVGKSTPLALVRAAPRLGRRPAGARDAGRRRPRPAARRRRAARPRLKPARARRAGAWGRADRLCRVGG